MSNKTMTLTDISKTSKEFKNTHTLKVGGFKNGGGIKQPRNNRPPKWFEDFVNNRFEPFVKHVEHSFERQEEFNKHVLDVFERNNLK